LNSSAVVHTVSYVLDTSGNGAALYARPLNMSGTLSDAQSSRSVVSRPGRKASCSAGVWH
jgi:hypothetical protein